MKLTVVLASQGPPELLAQCLRALEGQPVDQLLVSEGDRPLPGLRWARINEFEGDVIAHLEARAIPTPGWAQAIRAAHASEPAVIGGVLRPAPGASAFHLAQYFSDHAVAPISDANVSYKRAWVDRNRERLTSGEWETPLHVEAAAHGEQTVVDAVAVYRYDGRTASQVLSERFRHGRAYAARSGKRAQKTVFAPLLPAVLLARGLRAAARAGMLAAYLRALPWTCLLNLAWSIGEAVGGILGDE